MDIVTLPVLTGSTAFSEAFETMTSAKVSACVVQADTGNFLLDVDKVVEIGREWAELPQTLQFVTNYQPLLTVKDLPDPWRYLSESDRKAGERWLDQKGVRFALLRMESGGAVVMTRFELPGDGRGGRAAGMAGPPAIFQCVAPEKHRWTGGQLKGTRVCPHLVHSPPKPAVVQVI